MAEPVNLNRVRQVGRDEYELFDLARDGEDNYSGFVYESLEAASADADYGSWYFEDAEGNMRGPHLTESEARKAAKKLDEKP